MPVVENSTPAYHTQIVKNSRLVPFPDRGTDIMYNVFLKANYTKQN